MYQVQQVNYEMGKEIVGRPLSETVSGIIKAESFEMANVIIKMKEYAN